jgi:hypothetical protein
MPYALSPMLFAPCAALSRLRLGVINRDMLYKDLLSRWTYRSCI